MSHLLKQYRGQVDLIYIDPPFDSKADYKRTIEVRGKNAVSDTTSFEEKQYTDIWSNDEYLQFMYERLILCRELLKENGSLYVHCDWRKSHHLRNILDEIFGFDAMKNEIIWCYRGMAVSTSHFVRRHDNILLYSKSGNNIFNWETIADELETSTKNKYKHIDKDGRRFRLHGRNIQGSPIQNVTDADIKWLSSNPELCRVDYLDEKKGSKPRDWFIMDYINVMSNEKVGYPTQKPEALLERIIKVSSNPGDIVFDCFMGSGTTQAVAMKLGRRFIGADINLGSIETSTKRLVKIQQEISSKLALNSEEDITYFTGFEVYNVNNYDIFRNPVQAKDILIEALELTPLDKNTIFDGMKDDRMVKIMPINRLAARHDLNELIMGFDYSLYDKRRDANPLSPVDHITLVCMGHENDLAATLIKEMKDKGYNIDVEVFDILHDRGELQFKRDSVADVVVENGNLVVKEFFPMNLLNKLSFEKESVDDWRILVDSIKIDWNYDSTNFTPATIDIPEKNQLVKGIYKVPSDAGNIRIKITDLLSESLELSIE